MFFKPFEIKSTWKLYGDPVMVCFMIKLSCLQRCEPGLKALSAYVVLDDFKTFVPDLFRCALHTSTGKNRDYRVVFTFALNNFKDRRIVPVIYGRKLYYYGIKAWLFTSS